MKSVKFHDKKSAYKYQLHFDTLTTNSFTQDLKKYLKVD